MARFEIVHLSDHVHHTDFSRLFLVQIAVDGKPCVPFWSHASERANLGEQGWFGSLCERAEAAVAEWGAQSALL